jgi:hypothetical protein
MQAATRFSKSQLSRQELAAYLRRLLNVLSDVAKPSLPFDSAIADYVFVPLSLILRAVDGFHGAAIELILQCLQLLIRAGWRVRMPAELAKQLLMLCAFAAGGKPDVKGASQEKKSDVPPSEEQQLYAYECLTEIFIALKTTKDRVQALTEAENMPALGHVVTVVLDGLAPQNASQVRVAAIDALLAFEGCMQDRDVLSRFLPGIVMSTTKALVPGSKARGSTQFLVKTLQALKEVLRAVLGDIENISVSKGNASTSEKDENQKTETQIKLALSKITNLAQSGNGDVQIELLSLCLFVIEDCTKALGASAEMMLNTIIVLARMEKLQDKSAASDALERLCLTDTSVTALIKDIVYQNLISLPRVMQSGDMDRKTAVLQEVSIAYTILSRNSSDITMINNILLSNLQDSLTELIRADRSSRTHVTEQETSLLETTALIKMDKQDTEMRYESALVDSQPQQRVVFGLEAFLKQLSEAGPAIDIAQDALDRLKVAELPNKASYVWIILNLAKYGIEGNREVDQWLETSDDDKDDWTYVVEEAYFEALSIISNDDDNGYNLTLRDNIRLLSVSLELVALQSQLLGSSFRSDLVDVLFPVVHLSGSSSSFLRQHAQTTLNLIARNCDYSSAADLIVQNADYLVNALSLKLNTFNISPQAPIILLMMIKLAGPSLVPYLDDLVASISAALDNFHGYPKLVELLFAGLQGIVEVETKAAITLAIEDIPQKRIKPAQHMTFSEASKKLQAARDKAQARDDPDVEEIPRELPDHNDSDAEAVETVPSEADDENKKLSRSHDLTLKITSSTMNHLASPSPSLRNNLLHLIGTALPRLSLHEDTLLPLIANLFPPLLARLSDPEDSVVISATAALTQMLHASGGFLAQRIHTHWPLLRKLYIHADKELRRETKGGRERPVPYSLVYRRYDRCLELMVAIVQCCQLKNEILDDLLDLTAPVLRRHLAGRGAANNETGIELAFHDRGTSLREALEIVNADAVWLVLAERYGEGVAEARDRLPAPLEGLLGKGIEWASIVF